MRSRLEKNAVEFVTGPSCMERDVRDETDRRGFCGEHLKMMLRSQNILGVALSLQTRLMRVAGAVGPDGAKQKGVSVAGGCYVCDNINDTFERYVGTFFHLWRREEDFRRLAEGGKGFCLPHYSLLMNEGEKALGARDFAVFRETFRKIQLANMERLAGELERFLRKFDYRYADEPLGSAKDSVQRLMLKLSSAIVD